MRSYIVERARQFLSGFVSIVGAVFVTAFALIFASALQAQTAATGTISGRVLNAATGQYLRNAQVELQPSGRTTVTGDGGSFEFRNVPAGDVKLSVTYTGLDAFQESVTVTAGQEISRELALKSADYDSDTITLSAFVVSSAREGNAKAIVDQKQALNVKTVIAADAFGDVAEGNVGEFLKLLPGISVDYVDADVRAVRVRGLAPKYANFTLDGHPVATSASSSIDTGRQFEFEQVSLATLDVVEVNKSPTADMAASNLSGNINTVSKSAFSSKGRVIRYSANLTMNEYELNLDKSAGWDDERHYKALPGGMLEFSDTFLDGRLGVVAAASHSGSYAEQRILIGSSIFDRNPDNNQAETPVLNQWNMQHGLKPTFRDSIVLNLDYKATDDLQFSLRTSYNHYDAAFFNRNWLVNANTTGIAFDANGALVESSITAISNRSDTGARSTAVSKTDNNSYAQVQGSNLRKYGGTFIAHPSVRWTKDNLTVDAGASYSQSKNYYKSGDEGHFSAVTARMQGVSWEYVTAGEAATQIRQVSTANANNASFLDIANYTSSASVNNEKRSSKDQFWVANLDAELDMDSWNMPTKFKVGTDVRLNVRDIQNFNPQWTLNSNPATPASAPNGINLGQFPDPYSPNIGMGFSATDANGLTGNAPSTDKWKLFEVFKAGNMDPFASTANGAFSANAANNYRNFLQNIFDIEETIFSTYAMATTKVRSDLTLIGGLRYEKTETSGRGFDDLGHVRTLSALGLSTTIPPTNTTVTNDFGYIQRRYGSRVERKRSYDNLFPSAQFRYEPKRNLVIRGAYFASILRPDFSSTVGGVAVGNNDVTGNYAFTVRNTELDPETAHNFDAQVEYYFEPVGVVSFGAFFKDVEDIQVQLTNILDPNNLPQSILDLGYTASDVGSNSTISTRRNAGASSLWGFEASYQQELRFLPGFFRDFGVTANVTYVNPENVELFTAAAGGDGIPEWAANFILRYKYKKFSTQVSANWTDRRIASLTGVTLLPGGAVIPTTGVNNSNRYEWNDDRLVFGFNATYQIHRYATLFLNINNFTNAPQYRYLEREPFTSRYGEYGATYNVGIKGTF